MSKNVHKSTNSSHNLGEGTTGHTELPQERNLTGDPSPEATQTEKWKTVI